jgi:large subunit ribosomal protein L28
MSLNVRNKAMRTCDITGKGKQFGNNVSFSQRHTKKVWQANLQKKTIIIDGKKVTLKVSAQGLRILKKKGLLAPTPVVAK